MTSTRVAGIRQSWWLGIMCIVAFVLAFWPTFRWLAERFDASDSFYSHGWLVPFASAWLIWRQRALLESIPKQGSRAALLLLALSLLMHVGATWLHLGFVSGVSMLGTLYALVAVAWGWRVFWALRFPLLFLLFMIPLPGIVLITASFHMKLMAAGLATMCLRLLGLHAVQAGSMIRVPGVSVVVDDTCSGLRSLISLVALATIWTSIMPAHSTRWQKVAMVGASIPIALIANMVRILVLVLLAAVYGAQITETFIHYGSGLVVFGIALAALAWLSRVFERWQTARPCALNS